MADISKKENFSSKSKGKSQAVGLDSKRPKTPTFAGGGAAVASIALDMFLFTLNLNWWEKSIILLVASGLLAYAATTTRWTLNYSFQCKLAVAIIVMLMACGVSFPTVKNQWDTEHTLNAVPAATPIAKSDTPTSPNRQIGSPVTSTASNAHEPYIVSVENAYVNEPVSVNYQAKFLITVANSKERPDVELKNSTIKILEHGIGAQAPFLEPESKDHPAVTGETWFLDYTTAEKVSASDFSFVVKLNGKVLDLPSTR